ncbi:MAG: DNA polymerase III subunit gamma/tau [Chloroflexi bacterium]|nr:DNA polymerase III subunit gamma/tau [Chloroflexota bacterium]
MTQALYRKWRPRTWEEVVGQEHVVQTLRNAIAAERVAHAYLFAGPRGTGKTTTARLLAKAVNCLHPDPQHRPCDQCDHCQAINQGRFMDLIEIDAASNTSVDDIRDLRDKIAFAPSQGRYKVYIIDEVHMLSTAAFNALLKTLEEPPSHAIFVLATTEIHKIPATVLSRCQRYEFRRIPVAEMTAYLQRIVEGEGLEAEPQALQWVARQATGSLRDAISLLDQLASTGKPITLALARTVLGTAEDQTVEALTEALVTGELAAGLEAIHAALDGGADPRQLARQMVAYLRQVLLTKTNNADLLDVPPERRPQLARYAQAMSMAQLLRAIRAFEKAAAEARADWHPSLPLEVALVEAALVEPQAAPQPPQPRPVRAASSAPPQTPPPPAGPTASPSPSPSRLNLEAVLAAWKQLPYHLDASLRSLLNQQQAVPVEVADGVVVVGLRGSENTRRLLAQSERQETLARALTTLLGTPVAVRFKVLPGQGEVDPEILANHTMARVAVELGGKIVQAQIRKSSGGTHGEISSPQA